MARAARGAKKGSKLEAELEDLAPLEADPGRADAGDRLERALGSANAHVVARAAALIGKERMPGHEQRLLDAYERFLVDAAKSDPHCHAKLAILDALDDCEHVDSEPFIAAARYVQLEKRWGPPDDTAAGIRARCALALARRHADDALPLFGALLADEKARVRENTAAAIAHHGARDGAGLLVLRLMSGEQEPSVVAECIRALFALAPDHGAPVVRPWLARRELRELVAHALVASNRDEGVELLAEELARCVVASEREPIMRALAVSRRPSARALLLRLISGGGASDAPMAMRALAVHAYDGRVRADVREAASRNPIGTISDLVAELFPEEPK